MNVIDIIAIIPYFITLATVVAEEEDTLNLPKAPVSPQVGGGHWKSVRINPHACHYARQVLLPVVPRGASSAALSFFSEPGQVNQSGHVAGHTPCDTLSASVSNIQAVAAFERPADSRTDAQSLDARIRFTHIFLIHW